MVLNTAGVQNYNANLLQKITYNENNDPIFIDGLKGDVAFTYGLSEMRQTATYGGNFGENGTGKFTKYYSEDGSYEIVRNNQTGQEKHILYIGGTPYDSNILYLKDYTESSASYKFLHKDYLGSILAISDEAGNALEQRHYDAWGKFTHLKIANGAIITDQEQIANSPLLIDRGYTSHEHFSEVGLIHMNGRLYDPLLRRFLNADENIQDMFNTQNYNKYGYVLNNPLMYNDPSGEFLPLIAGLSAFWTAVVVGSAVGVAAYCITSAVMGQQLTPLGVLKSAFFGAISGAATFGIGSIFTSCAGSLTVAESLAQTVGGLGSVVIQAGTHAISQGVLSLMQGGNLLSSAASGFFGSLGASAFGAAAGGFAKSAVGTIAFGALAGGVGSELAGGNFWQGAVIGGTVAGLNHAMHSGDMEPDNGYDENGKKINDLGGDKTDYILRKNPFGGDSYQILDEVNVRHSSNGYSDSEGYGYRVHKGNLPSPALYDPSFDIAVGEIGGGVIFKGVGVLAKGTFMTERIVYRAGGQSTFAVKWMNQGKSFMFRLERQNSHIAPGVPRAYTTHINLHNLKTGANKHIFLNPKYWKYSR